MKINRKLRLQMLMQNSLFVLLFLALIGLIGAVTREFSVSRDVTQGGRNTLTEGSINVLRQMKLPVHITVYASKDDTSKKEQYRKKYSDFVGRYQRSKPDITLEFIDPAEQPKLAQDAGIKVDGEFVVEYAKRTEHIIPPFVEQDMTNVLVRLSRTNERPIMYLDGHGERSLIGVKNHDIGEFGKQLEKRGFRFANPDLTIVQAVPSNGAMLIIASPQLDLSEIEVKKIRDYLNAGGNLLWLLDDDNLHGLKPIAEHLSLTVSPGMVVDLSSAQYGANASLASANVYGEHAITKNFMLHTFFPEARKVDAQDSYEHGWEVTHLIEVAPNGWLEKGKIEGKVSFDAKQDERGPINIAVALERIYGKKGQRIVVVGNGNFLSNTFITNGGNLDLGVNIINWLAGDDNLITIQPKPLKDVTMIIPDTDSGRILAWFVFNGFQYFIPLFFVIAGMVHLVETPQSMKSRWLINLALLVLVAALGAFVYLRPEQGEQKQSGYELSTLKLASFSKLSIEFPAKASVAFEKIDGHWRITQPYKARADQVAVQRVLSIIAATSAEKFPATDLGRFGLDNPKLKLKMDNETFLFGTINPVSGDQYVAYKDAVYLLPASYSESASIQLVEFIDKSPIKPTEKIVGFDFSHLEQWEDIRLHVDLVDGKWKISAANAKPNQNEMNEWLDVVWVHASANAVEPYTPDRKTTLPGFEIKMKDGTKVHFDKLQESPELLLGRPDESLIYHFPADAGFSMLNPPINITK